MHKMKWITVLVLWLTSGSVLAQVGQQRADAKETASLDAEREKRALQVLAKLTEKVIVSAADMPCPPTSTGLRQLMVNSRACVPLVKW